MMTLEANNDATAIDDDLKTTVPNMQPAEWKMPEPVFRKTSGRLPKLLETKVEAARVSGPETSPDVQIPGAAFQTPEPTLKSPVLKLVVVALALAAMIAFIAAFLTVVYFLFVR